MSKIIVHAIALASGADRPIDPSTSITILPAASGISPSGTSNTLEMTSPGTLLNDSTEGEAPFPTISPTFSGEKASYFVPCTDHVCRRPWVSTLLWFVDHWQWKNPGLIACHGRLHRPYFNKKLVYDSLVAVTVQHQVLSSYCLLGP